MDTALKTGHSLQLIESGPLRYLLSFPSTTPKQGDALRPVLCFLHGYDEAAPLDIYEAIGRHGPLRPGIWPEAVGQFIIIAPQLPVAGDIWYRYAEAVEKIVVDARGRYQGDPRRTYLTGFSFGADGVFDLAVLQPGFWAALWAVDPTRVPLEDPRRPVWLSIGGASRYQKSGFIRSLGLTLAGAAAGSDRLYLDQGQDHVGSARVAYEDPRVYRWLLSKQLPSVHR